MDDEIVLPLRPLSGNHRLDIVIPLWNEETVLGELHQRLVAACEKSGMACRIIYVDDGSRDSTVPELRSIAAQNPAVSVIFFSRNFGQPQAIAAGMMESDGEAVVLLDGDLQDPPELIPQMVAAWQNSGASVVIAKRTSREESGLIRRFLFSAFHRVFSRLSEIPIPPNTGTFSLMSRQVVDTILSLPESHRFFPGLRAWAGFETVFVEYARPERKGESPRQTLSRLIRYAGDAVFGFSMKPVVWMLYAAMFTAAFAFGAIAGTIAFVLVGASELLIASGVFCAAIFLALSLQLTATTYVAELIRRVYEQSKLRPLFVVSDTINCQSDSSASKPKVSTALARKIA